MTGWSRSMDSSVRTHGPPTVRLSSAPARGAARAACVALAVGLLTAAIPAPAAASPAAPGPQGDELTREDEAQRAGQRLREGAKLVDQLGSFQLTSDRATFTTVDRQHKLEGLPNLNLERIVRTLRDHPDQLVWSVSGTVTEYQGANYILITRAVLKSKQSQQVAIQGQRPSPGGSKP